MPLADDDSHRYKPTNKAGRSTPLNQPGGEQGRSGLSSHGSRRKRDLTDGRKPGDWKTRWKDPAARSQINREFAYLAVAMTASFVLILLTWDGHLGRWLATSSASHQQIFDLYTYAALGGLVGGTTFSLRWLCNSVAHDTWNADRWIWRVATPVMSTALALALFALVRSDLVSVIDVRPLSHGAGSLSFGFLAGYFSDNVVGAMLRAAEHIFGTVGLYSADARSAADVSGPDITKGG